MKFLKIDSKFIILHQKWANRKLQELVTENQFDTSEHLHDKLVSILEPIEINNLEEVIFNAANIGRTKFEEIFGWTGEQSSAINLYSTLLQMVETVEEKLKTKGLKQKNGCIM
jgi:hypothetical protein